ncbi:MAG TPA: TonB C-terminal domain-containing protein [Candidatus Acidoferrales bacterium]|nr:TonB C-terminal domain-containing protein [Candidatus Acidoferrales bacterium]
MIPRILVPLKISRVDPNAPPENGQRRTSALDSRIVVPTGPSDRPLETHSSIPSYLPLDVLASRMLIPRDMPVKPLESSASTIPAHVPIAVLETRIVVPQEAKLDQSTKITPQAPLPAQIFQDILEPDLFTTGEINLLASPEKPQVKDWQWLARSFSLIVHVGVILLILFLPKLFNTSEPTQEVQLAREQLARVFLPPSVREIPKERPRAEQPSARIRLDPRILKQLTPPQPPQPAPLAGPKNTAPPQPEVSKTTPPQPPPTERPKTEPAFKPLTEVQPPPPTHKLNLDIPHLSPGQEIEKSAQEALQNRNSSTSASITEPLPQAPGAPPPSGANGEGQLGSGVQILTPTQGVDFSNYLARLIARVQQNWDSVMPISARMGDKGVVVMHFHIMRNGDMPNTEPFLERTSGKEPLDRAAAAALTESNPFEPLPSAFTGPYIELRIIFLYNLPMDYNYNQ